MADQNDVKIIHNALDVLGVSHGDASTIQTDTQQGLEELIKLLNEGKEPQERIPYSRETGWTPEVRAALDTAVQSFKTGDDTGKLYGIMATTYESPLVPDLVVEAAIEKEEGLPEAITSNPKAFYTMLRDHNDLLEAVDHVYAAPVPAAAPVASPPAPDRTPPASLDAPAGPTSSPPPSSFVPGAAVVDSESEEASTPGQGAPTGNLDLSGVTADLTDNPVVTPQTGGGAPASETPEAGQSSDIGGGDEVDSSAATSGATDVQKAVARLELGLMELVPKINNMIDPPTSAAGQEQSPLAGLQNLMKLLSPSGAPGRLAVPLGADGVPDDIFNSSMQGLAQLLRTSIANIELKPEEQAKLEGVPSWKWTPEVADVFFGEAGPDGRRSGGAVDRFMSSSRQVPGDLRENYSKHREILVGDITLLINEGVLTNEKIISDSPGLGGGLFSGLFESFPFLRGILEQVSGFLKRMSGGKINLDHLLPSEGGGDQVPGRLTDRYARSATPDAREQNDKKPAAETGSDVTADNNEVDLTLADERPEKRFQDNFDKALGGDPGALLAGVKAGEIVITPIPEHLSDEEKTRVAQASAEAFAAVEDRLAPGSGQAGDPSEIMRIYAAKMVELTEGIDFELPASEPPAAAEIPGRANPDRDRQAHRAETGEGRPAPDPTTASQNAAARLDQVGEHSQRQLDTAEAARLEETEEPLSSAGDFNAASPDVGGLRGAYARTTYATASKTSATETPDSEETPAPIPGMDINNG